MTTTIIDILYIEDNLADYKLLTSRLSKEKKLERFEFTHATTLSEADKILLDKDFSLLLLDLSLPDAHGLDGLNFLLKHYSIIPIVVLTGNSDENIAIEAIKHGAQDYLVKQDLQPNLFIKTCEYAIERKKINKELKEAVEREEELNEDLREANIELNKAFEQLKQEKQRVEDKNQQINSFISVLVNDLKNPISAISSLTELIKEDGITAKQAKFIEQITRSSDSMLENILRIIDTQDAADGVIKVNLQAENPFYTLNSAIDKYVVEAIKRNIIIEVNYKNNLPQVLIDKSTFNSAISGIFDFIFQMTHKPTRLVVSSEEADAYLHLHFLDKQLELSQNAIDKSLENSNSSDIQKLELAFVKELLQMMGGDLEIVPNKEGKGTVFTLFLKYAELVSQ